MDDARTTKRLKVPAAAAAVAVTTRCDDERFFTNKKQHQQHQTIDTISDGTRKQRHQNEDFPRHHLLLSEYTLNEARTEIVLAETKRDIEMAIERIYREAMKLDHFCGGGGSGGTFGRHQSLVVGFDMEWKVLYKKGGGEAKTSLLQMAYSTSDVSKSSSETKNVVVVLIRLGKRLKYKNPLPSKLVRFLEDPAVMKAGVNARGDAQKLRRDFKVSVNGVVELDALAKAKNVASGDGRSSGKSVSGKEQERDTNNNASQRWSLARLAIRVLKKRVPKDGNTRTSNWERDGKLDRKQLTYAAIDAMVGLDLWAALNKMRGDGYEMDPVPEGFVFRGRILEGEYDPDDDDDDEEDDDDDEVDYDEEEIEPYAALREAALTTLENETTISGQPEQPKTKEQLELTRGAKRKTPIPEDVEEILIQHLGGKAVENIAETLKLKSADISKKLTIAFKAGHPYYWDLLGVSNDIWLTFLQSREEKALATIRERLPNGAADMPKILLCACRFAREVLRDGNQLEGDESADDDDDEEEEEEEEESSSEENDDEDDDASEEEEGKKE